jgi:hypothetical protein
MSMPETFEASIGNLRDGYYVVRLLDAGTVVWSFETGEPPELVEAVVPDNPAWQTFADALGRVGAFGWLPNYEDRSVLDGTHWHVSCAWQDKLIQSSGANAFPDGFDDFCRAVEQLLEGRTFH